MLPEMKRSAPRPTDTAAPAPLLLRGLADIAIEQKAVSEKLGPKDSWRRPVGTGPWKYVEWVPGDRYDLVGAC